MKKLVILALLLMSPAVFGAISIVQSARTFLYDASTTVSCGLSPTGASHNLIVGAIRETFGSGVASVVDNQGNTYTRASGSGARAEIWHSLGATAGVTSVTISFGSISNYGFGVGYKQCFVYEVAGTVTFDAAANLDSGQCTSSVCNGQAVNTSTSTGFVVGIIFHDALEQNYIFGTPRYYDPNYGNPKIGNEFTAGSLIGLWAWSGAVGLISTNAASHQPVWGQYSQVNSLHDDPDLLFSTATAAYKQ